MKKKIICNKCSQSTYIDFPILETSGLYSITDFLQLCNVMITEGLLPFVRISHTYGNKLDFSFYFRCEICGVKQDLTLLSLIKPPTRVAPLIEPIIEPIVPVVPVLPIIETVMEPIIVVGVESIDHSTLITTASVTEDPCEINLVSYSENDIRLVHQESPDSSRGNMWPVR